MAQLDAGGRVVSVNPAMVKLLGHPAVADCPLTDLLDAVSARSALTRRLLRGRSVVARLAANGPWVLIEPSLPLASGAADPGQVESSGPVRILYFRNVDASRRRRAAARCQAQDLQRANALRTRFFASVGHDIRTPLTLVVGFAELLGAERALAEAEKARVVRVIQSNSRLLLRLIHDLLDLAKLEAGVVEVKPAQFCFETFLSDLKEAFAQQGSVSGLDFELKAPPTLPKTLRSDSARIRQVLNNVIGNALKYTDAGKVAVDVRVEPELAGSTPADGLFRLTFEVSDTGRGIAASEHGKLFQAFERPESTAPRDRDSNGLGLFLGRRVARALGGDVTLVNSAPGKGSVFSASFAVQAEP